MKYVLLFVETEQFMKDLEASPLTLVTTCDEQGAASPPTLMPDCEVWQPSV